MILFQNYTPIYEAHDEQGVPVSYLLKDNQTPAKGIIISVSEEQAKVEQSDVETSPNTGDVNWKPLSSSIEDIHYSILKTIRMEEGIDMMNRFKRI